MRVELPPMRPMELDPTYVPYLESVLASRDVPIHLDDPAARRARMAAARRTSDPPPGVSVVEATADGVPVRVYRPEEIVDDELPAIVYIHGGGWMYGSVEQSEPIAARYCREVGAVVVSVEYRLTPQHRFPSGLDDCVAALDWTAASADSLGVDPTRLALAGESSGANLAAACALVARDRGRPPLRLQVLHYPALGVDFETVSYQENADAPVLSRDEMTYFWQHYLRREEDWLDGRAVPLNADVTGVAPAFLSTAEYDPLRDDGTAYVDRLRAAGVEVTHVRADRLPHGFLRAWGVSEDAAEVGAAAVAALRRAFGSA